MHSIYDWLDNISDPVVRERAMKAQEEAKEADANKELKRDSLIDALHSAFNWSVDPSYWSRVSRLVREGIITSDPSKSVSCNKETGELKGLTAKRIHYDDPTCLFPAKELVEAWKTAKKYEPEEAILENLEILLIDL